MTDKIMVVTICRNEMDLLPYTLPQSIKWADKVIVLDGGPESTSTDGTWEYLQVLKGIRTATSDFIGVKVNRKFDDKLHIETGTYGSDHTSQNNWDRLMRQYYLDILTAEDYDGWIFLIDADETFTDEDWVKIKEYVKIANQTNKIMIRFPYINFFYDLNHVVHDRNFDTPAHHLSIFEPGCRYLDNSTLLRDMTGRCYTHYPPDRIMLVPDVSLYHYSHIKSEKEEKERAWRYRFRGDLGPQEASKTPANINEWNWVDPRIEELKNASRVKLFTGKHPHHMLEYVEKFNLKVK